MRKPTHSKVMGFLNMSGEEEIHKIPKLWDEWVFMFGKSMGKDRDFPDSALLQRFRVSKKPMQLPVLGNVQIPIKWKYSVKSHKVPRLWVFEEIRSYYLLFNIKLESYGWNPVFKKRSVGKIFELKETYNLTVIWKIRNPKAKRYTFQQKYVSGFLQRRLD